MSRDDRWAGRLVGKSPSNGVVQMVTCGLGLVLRKCAVVLLSSAWVEGCGLALSVAKLSFVVKCGFLNESGACACACTFDGDDDRRTERCRN